jgi:LysR family hydrogen peroxide-inducible transcriptional activator
MNIKDLTYFIAVAELKHFGQAALRCHVSQPALSMQLKKLEDALGVLLFDRNNKQVIITPAGETLLAQAKQIILEVNTLKAMAQQMKDPLGGPFHLGIIPTLGPYLLPSLLEEITKKLPNLTLHVLENKTNVLLTLLREGTLDAVIVALPIENNTFVTQTLFSEAFFVALPQDNPLSHKKVIEMADLQQNNLLLLEEGHCLREQALEICQIKTNCSFQFTASSLETLYHLVGAGHGITLLPALAVTAMPKNPKICIRPFKNPVPSRQIAMLWRKASSRNRCCLVLSELITENPSRDR